MAFLVVEGNINKTVKKLQALYLAAEAMFARDQKEEDKQELKEVADKLRCAEAYQVIYNQRSYFRREVAHLKKKDPEKFIERSKKAIEGVKGISFDKKTMQFRARIMFDGKRTDLGYHDSPASAVDSLDAFLG